MKMNPKVLALARISDGKASSSSYIAQWPRLTLYGDLDMRPFRSIWMLEEIQLPYTHIACKPWSRVAKSIHPLGKIPALMVEDLHATNEGGGGDTEAEGNNSFVVLESAAINTFLGDVARELAHQTFDTASMPMLVPPPSTLQRAKYDMLSMFVMTEIDSQSLWIERKHGQLSNVFGDAPVAVQEAKRQFDNALNVMVDEIITNNDRATSDMKYDGHYLLSTGFSAVDILFAHCCSWAQQIGWLAKESVTLLPSSVLVDGANHDIQDNVATKSTLPTPLAPELAVYLERCHSRPAYLRAKELRKNQVGRRTTSNL
jgi:glutathione S-transferase